MQVQLLHQTIIGVLVIDEERQIDITAVWIFSLKEQRLQVGGVEGGNDGLTHCDGN